MAYDKLFVRGVAVESPGDAVMVAKLIRARRSFVLTPMVAQNTLSGAGVAYRMGERRFTRNAGKKVVRNLR